MPGTEPRRGTEEIAGQGAEAYDRHVRPALRPEDDDKFVAIDIDTGDYELDADDYAAVIRWLQAEYRAFREEQGTGA